MTSSSDIEKVLTSAVLGDLFIFNIENVLIEKEDPTFRSHFFKQDELDELDEFTKFINEKREDVDFFSQFLLESRMKAVDENLVKVIQEMMRKGIKIIALTAPTPTGKYGIIPNMAQWKYEQLVEAGLNFDNSYKQDIIFKSEAVFYKGILFSGNQSKETILKEFLTQVETPNRIFYFGQTEKNVKEMGTECQGFHYCTKEHKHSNLLIAYRQLSSMKERNIYVSYKQVEIELIKRFKEIENRTGFLECLIHRQQSLEEEIEFDELTHGLLHTTYFYHETREDGKMRIDKCKFESCKDFLRRCSWKAINVQILNSKDDRVIREWNKEQLDLCRRIFSREKIRYFLE